MLENYREIVPLGKNKHIWLVVHEETGKVYVKKRLDVFKREVYESLERLHHKNISAVLELHNTEGGFYIVEEYIGGETLEERMERDYTFSESEAIEIMLQVCDALEFLHQQNPPIIHRDVKLSNIMITNDGVVKLIDYNAARYYEEGASKDTILIGTVGYAAPEQFGFRQTDMRTDIYSVGIVLNEILTKHHINEALCEGTCGEVVKKCVQMDPEKRYQNIQELKAVLQSINSDNGMKTEGKQGANNLAKKDRILNILIVFIGYLAAIVLASQMSMGGDETDLVLYIVEKACLCAHLLFMAALAVNFCGIAGKIPIVKHRRVSIQIAGFIIWWQISRYAAEGVFLIIKAFLG